MSTEEKQGAVTSAENQGSKTLLWFAWGVLLSFTTICSVVLLVTVLISAAVNIYLAWELAGMELVVRPRVQPTQPPVIITPTPTAVVMAPTNTPQPVATSTPLATPTQSPLEARLGTLVAQATNIPTVPPTNTPMPTATESPLVEQLATLSVIATQAATANEAAVPSLTNTPVTVTGNDAPEPEDVLRPTPASAEVAGRPAETGAEAAQEFAPPAEESYTSSNSYERIPLEGDRDPRPAEEHGDLNIALREPQPIEADLSLQEIDGSGIDPNAPKLKPILEPEFTQAYAVHNWDWGCNCKGDLFDEVDMIGIKTTPGKPVFIPHKQQDIWAGDYFALLLYASEDTVTFAYARDGTVAHSYAIHYQGLRTDPNLLALYRESKGNELPGLALDTPVGIATDELRVAIRDKGTFMDPRSLRDWWD